MPTSSTDTNISLDIHILVKTGCSAPCSCCFTQFQKKNKLVPRKYNEQGSRNTLKHHIVKNMLAFHRVMHKTCPDIVGKQREKAEFGEHRCLSTVQPPCWESLPSSRMQTFKNPEQQNRSHTWLSVMLRRKWNLSQNLASISIFTLNFYFYSVNSTMNRNKLPKFHIQV